MPDRKPAAASRRPPDSARRVAALALQRVLEEGAYANLVLASALTDDGEEPSGSENREAAGRQPPAAGQPSRLDARDRAFATAMVYGTLTRLHTIDHVLSERLSQPLPSLEPMVRTILRLGVFQLLYSRSVPPSAACDESVRLCRRLVRPPTQERACGLVNAVLRTIARDMPEISPKNAPLYYSLPPELYGYVKKAAGPVEAPLLAERMLDAPPVTLRVNRLRATPDEAAACLAEDGIATQAGRFLPEALVPDLGGQPVQNLAAYRAGLVSVQDEGAMLTGHVLDPQPGECIIDLCAAPGGKSAHLAELSGDAAEIDACDIHPGRVELIRKQAERLGIHSIHTWTADATGKDWPPELAGPFDRVLADVPCSGLGLLARKPEIRRNMTHARILGLMPLQAAILQHAATLVRPGGVLVYSTCTFNPAENDGQVERFLTEQAGRFQREDMRPFLPPVLLADPETDRQAADGAITLLPHRHGTDGFFIARLRRVGDTMNQSGEIQP